MKPSPVRSLPRRPGVRGRCRLSTWVLQWTEAKRLHAKTVFIDETNIPAGFIQKISPSGTLPAAHHGNRVILGANKIIAYISHCKTFM